MSSSEHAALRERLSEFFRDNPAAEFQVGEEGPVVAKPWGDSTIEIQLREVKADLISSLNAVLLPPRLSALWHKDTKDIEFIWTTSPVESALRSRSFEFSFRDRRFRCEYGDSSPRLLNIAEATRPVAPASSTDHRGLYHFNLYLHYKREHTDSRRFAGKAPTCFWIRNVELDDDFVLNLCRHLNFYMYYFDPGTPTILVHEDPPRAMLRPGPFPVLGGPFPGSIAGRPLDPYLLSLWGSAVGGDHFLRFLYSYQILEYGAFYHLQEEALQVVRRVLVSPETPAQAEEAAQRILDAVCEVRSADEAKIVAVVKKCVDPGIVWRQIEQNRDFFCAEVVFEGGFRLPPLLKSDWDMDDFAAAWIPAFPDALRKIRNAIVHSREARMARSIIGTRENHMKLRAWIGPIAVTAMQVMIYKDA